MLRDIEVRIKLCLLWMNGATPETCGFSLRARENCVSQSVSYYTMDIW